jgi:hypothetical protein
MNRLAVAVLAAFCFAPIARTADLACDTPGIAQMIIPDLFNNNPSAQKLGLEVSKVTVLSIQETTEGGSALSRSLPAIGRPFATSSDWVLTELRRLILLRR